MSRRLLYILLLGACAGLLASVTDDDRPYRFVQPEGWPKPTFDLKKNRVTPGGFNLGKTLFNDPILSKDNSVSCASCHLQFTAYTHVDHDLSHGIYGKKGTRNSPALFNLAWNSSFMWDGGVADLVLQPVNPITNPVEMGSTVEEVLLKLNASAAYRQRFFEVYGDSIITKEKMLGALAQFTVMIQSYNSKYDSVMRKEHGVAFTASEEHGYKVFRQHCNSCHREPLFTDQTFRNNGLAMDSTLKDIGRMAVTMKRDDSLKFRVPSLRNVAASAPYMHDGRFPRLKDVIEHYTNGITESNTLDRELRKKMELTIPEKRDLLAFLNTLTDNLFLYDVRFRAEPTLPGPP